MGISFLDTTIIDSQAMLANPQALAGGAAQGAAAVPDTPAPHLLTLSARDPAALRATAQQCLDWLMMPGRPTLRDFAAALALRADHHDHRLAMVTDSLDDFATTLRAFLDGGTIKGLAVSPASPVQDARTVFVFTGMGPRWETFGRGLFNSEPAFRKVVEAANAALAVHSGSSLLSRIGSGAAATPAAMQEMAQPMNFVLQLGLAALWRSWGIEPAAVVGYSVGEVAAAHLAGALCLDDAARIVHHLSQIGPMLPPGGMLATRLTPKAAAALQQQLNGAVTIAAVNSPCSVVLAGPPDALAVVAERLRSDGILSRWLAVDLAFHTPHMDHLRTEVFAALDGLRPCAPTTPLYSTVTATPVDRALHDAQYWWNNLRRPVLFAATMERMIDDGLRLFLENSPRPSLASSIRECTTRRGVSADVLSSLTRGRPERTTMLEALGALYCRGHRVAWTALHPAFAAGSGHGVLPWQDADASRPAALMPMRRDPGQHALLYRRIPAPNPTWETELDAATLIRLWRLESLDAPIVPKAALVEAALAVGQLSGTGRAGALEGMEFRKPLPLVPGERRTLRLELSGKTGDLTIYSIVVGAAAEWTLHATARLSAAAPSATTTGHDLDAIRARCLEITQTTGLCHTITGDKRRRDIGAWPVRRIWQGRHELLAELVNDGPLSADGDTGLEPALLEAAFHASAAILPDEPLDGPCTVTAIGQVVLHGRASGRLWCHGRLARQTELGFESDLVLYDDTSRLVAEVRGLRCQSPLGLAQRDAAERIQDCLYACTWEPCDVLAPTKSAARQPGRWLILADSHGPGSELAAHLDSQGATSARICSSRRLDAATFDALACELEIDRYSGIIYLGSLDAASGTPDPAVPDYAITNPASLAPCRPVLALVRWLTRREAGSEIRLVIATAGVHDVADTPARAEDPLMPSQASLWGLGRVVMQEYPRLRCTLIDLDAVDQAPGLLLLAQDLQAGIQEQEIAYRGSTRFIHRLARKTLPDASPSAKPVIMPTTVSMALQVPQPGVLRKIRLCETHRRPPGPREVELHIQAVGLNFKDVLKMMGWLPASVQEDTFFGAGLGMEAAATVTRAGSGVGELRAGDQIIAMPRGGCLQSYITVPLDHLFWVPRLKGSPWLEQAGMPVIFATAYYGLHELARVQPGEKVLLHCATGGVGLAAIQVARWLDADIFATAGSPEKRAYLRSLGIKHVMDSRSLAFAGEIMALTDGRGVDVVLNFLSGEALEKSISVLAPFGRLIELGKRDMEENNALPLRAFNRSLTFSAVDLDRLAVLHPDILRRVLRAVWHGAGQNRFRPVHTQVYPIGQIADASRTMLKAKHTGKIVLQMQDQMVPVLPARAVVPRCHDNATYLVSGLSGLISGQSSDLDGPIIRWLLRQGARNLVLVRSCAGVGAGAGVNVRPLLDDPESQGAHVLAATCDISNQREVAALMARIDDTMPPLRGVVHVATAGNNTFLADLDPAGLARTAAPLLAEAWNLHHATQFADMDFFITLSSAAGLLGSSGQASRAAISAFLDGLSRHRVALGLPATNLCLSDGVRTGTHPASSPTMSAGHQRNRSALEAEDIIKALTLVSDAKPVQIAVIKVNWSHFG